MFTGKYCVAAFAAKYCVAAFAAKYGSAAFAAEKVVVIGTLRADC